MAQLSQDSRKTKRKPVNVSIEFKGRKGSVSCVTENLSTGGMFVSTKEPLPVSQRAFFRFKSEAKPMSFNIEGEVVWNNGRGCRVNRKDIPDDS